MNGLFITDELADCVYGEEKNGRKSKTLFRKADNSGENTYLYVYGGEMKEKIAGFYEKALRYFKRAINYNPGNPRYYYEYARCLQKFGQIRRG
jgi:hypothetical protein